MRGERTREQVEMNKSQLKIAIAIAAVIEAVLVGVIIIFINRWGAHSAIMSRGVILQFPASIAGIAMGYLTQSVTGSGELAGVAMATVTVLLQLAILASVIYLLLRIFCKGP
jgi:hypothetical protein